MLTLVTGGGGRLGNVLVRRLLRKGHRVRVLEAADRPASLAGLQIELMSGSVLSPSAVAAAIDGADAVYHLAAIIDLRPKKDPMMVPTNVVGTRVVVDACAERGVRLVHTSSHHALVREPLDQPLTEEKPLALRQRCMYHRSKAVAETIVLDACARGLDATIVNPGSMIGPHDYAPSIVGAALIDLYFGRVPALLDVASDYVYLQSLSYEGDHTGKAISDLMLRSGAPDRRVIADDYYTRHKINDKSLHNPKNWFDRSIRRRSCFWRTMTSDRWASPFASWAIRPLPLGH